MTRPAAHALLTRLRLRAMRRALLSSYVLNGAAVALGMFLITALIHATLGPVASANASVGTIIALISDNPRACRGKFSHLIAAPILVERPIVETPKGARIGRPVERVLDVL